MAPRKPHNQAQIWRDPAMAGIELFQGTFVSHTFPQHAHAGYSLGISDAGCGTIFCRGSRWLAAPQRLIFFHPGEIHGGCPQGEAGWRYRMVYFDPALGGSMPLSFPEPTFDHGAIAHALHHLYTCMLTAAPLMERETALQRWLDLLRSQAPSGSPYPGRGCLTASPPQAMRLIQDYLEAHYSEEISIQTLAQLVSLSPSYLITAFQASVGIPPHRYLMQVRVRQAQQQLRTPKPLAAIATDTGFCDQSHLNRWFKRIVGLSPHRYRQGIWRG